MYLRQSNKWKQWLLQEAVEDIGLPPAVAHFLRQQDEAFGPVDNKHLTWIGQLVKEQRQDLLLPRENLMEIRRHLQQAVRTTLEKRGVEDKEVFGELFAEALAPLMEFRDEREKQSPNIADIKKFKKRFMKNLRKLEIEPKFIKGFDSYVDNRMVMGVRDHLMKSVKPIMLLLAEDPQSYNDLRDESGLQMVGKAAEEILANPPKAEDQVIHEFDNGYFWYDIRSSACNFEAKKMGHCGRGEQGTLVSLRSGEGRSVKPMITLEFDGGTLYQIKGKANQPPKEDLWPYIEWFIENMGVESIKEAPSEMMGHFQEKYPDLDWGNRWASHADELLDQYEAGIETDEQTDVELDRAADGDDEEVGVVLTHQAYWPILDKVIEEDSDKLVWEITQDAKSLADDTLYPNPTQVKAAVFRRGEQDSLTAMLRIELWWSKSFKEPDPGNEYDAAYEEAVTKQLEHLHEFLEEMEEISGYLVSTESAPDDAEFDYNEFHEKVQKRLEAYGVYRDVAGEIDAEKERDREDQLELPLPESRIIRRWSRIIK
jgi:hypothetical protein